MEDGSEQAFAAPELTTSSVNRPSTQTVPSFAPDSSEDDEDRQQAAAFPNRDSKYNKRSESAPDPTEEDLPVGVQSDSDEDLLPITKDQPVADERSREDEPAGGLPNVSRSSRRRTRAEAVARDTVAGGKSFRRRVDLQYHFD